MRIMFLRKKGGMGSGQQLAVSDERGRWVQTGVQGGTSQGSRRG